MSWPTSFTDKAFLLKCHTGEEFVITLICFIIAFRLAQYFKDYKATLDQTQESRIWLLVTAFIILGISSFTHAIIHVNHLNQNLLYQTILGYCFGLLTIVVAISSEKPVSKKIFLLCYLPVLSFLLPGIYERFPIFGQFRPLIWIGVAYLSGLVCMLLFAAFYRSRRGNLLCTAIGFLLISVSATFLFFPAPIGSPVWLHGHLFRLISFSVILFCINRVTFVDLGSSILFRALSAFSLLAAIPLLLFGSVMFYENINPLGMESRRALIFVLMLVSFAVTLIFALGVIIRLIKPLLLLKISVDHLVDEGLSKNIPVASNDEIGELANAFNQMVVKLRRAIEEQDRLCRLAATGELAATLAHEIKNPLNAIGGAANYIKKNYDGSLIVEFTGVISDEVSRIDKLTTALLGFAKPMVPEIAANNVNEIVGGTILLLREEVKAHCITLTANLGENLPPAHCDPNQIKQVLINLIINAMDAVGKNGTISVSTSFLHGKIRLDVTDDGIGIAPEKKKDVFNPFYTTKTRGTGLGLAISKKIAKEHQGDLVLESVEGQGSKFTLILQGDTRNHGT